MLVMMNSFFQKLNACVLNSAASDSILMEGHVGLLKANISPEPTLTLGNVTPSEANFSGYARGILDFGSDVNFVDANGIYGQQSADLVFSPSDTITPNTIYGAFWIGGDSITLMGVEMFDAPIPLSNPLQNLTYIPRFGMLQNGPNGFGVVVP